MKMCKKCVLKEDFPGIKFDEKGICNFCNTYEKYNNKLTNHSELKRMFKNRIEKIKGKNEYDCLVGLSGGKDSSYVLYQLKNKYNLNILAYTFDNGFLNDYARKNIRRVLEEIDVDHLYFKPNKDFQKRLYRKMIEIMATPCKGCSLGMYGTSIKFAFEKEIPFVVHGRSPAQMFRELAANSKDPFLPFIRNNLSEYSRKRNLKTLLNVKRKIGDLIQKERKDIIKKMEEKFFPDEEKLSKSDIIPEFLGYFIYHRYKEENIKSTIEDKIGWRRSDKDNLLSHGDCIIHNDVEKLKNKKTGYITLEPELSVLIRQGKITKKEALERIKREKEKIEKEENIEESIKDKIDF